MDSDHTHVVFNDDEMYKYSPITVLEVDKDTGKVNVRVVDVSRPNRRRQFNLHEIVGILILIVVVAFPLALIVLSKI